MNSIKQAMSHVPFLKREDTNGIVYVFAGNIGGFVLVASMLLSFGWPEDLIFKRVIPGICVGLLVQGVYYAWMAYRLARKEGRSDVTALPSGLSTPVVFVYLFGVIVPLQFGLGLAPEQVWMAATAACFLGGLIEAFGGIIGPFIRKLLPRAAMLATVAGIALVWMATKGLFDVYAEPVLGMPILIIAMIGLIGGYVLPKKVPPLLVAIVAGIIYALVLGKAQIVTTGLGQLTLPSIGIAPIIQGFKYVLPFLSIIIPVEIYNFIETMDNVEAAHAAGDRYNVGEAQMVDGVATMISAVCGGIMPNTVWLGHAGLKKSGCGIGYSWVSGVLFAIAGFFGFFQFLYHLVPEVVIAITYLWCAMVMISQAFVDTPRRHSAAIAIAFVPHIANYAYTEITGALYAVGVEAVTPEIASSMMANGVMWGGVEALYYGSIIIGMMWAAITVFIIDRKLVYAGHIAMISAGFTFIGLIHSSIMGINAGPTALTIGYLSVAGICYLTHALRDKLHFPVRFDYV